MSLRVYNSLSQQKELFEPVRPGKVGIYLCGPTVYKPPHIGHMVGPVIFDAIKRYLMFKGFEVTWVVNITDVDDKLIDAAEKAGVPMKQLAERYAEQYFEILKLYGVDTIDRFPKASEHIAEMIGMCEKLIAKGHAYAAEGNVWFDVASDPDYGKLNHRHVEEQESGTRGTESSGKRNALDFALWKAAKPGEPTWDSPWGPGRPGWHIECSAMSMKYLGETLDIHGGGMDLKFPHHENELAQSESCTGKPFARYWLHNGLTKVNTKKVSGTDLVKPENAALLEKLDARNLVQALGTDLVRYFLLGTHYRSPIDFSDETIEACKRGLQTFLRLFERVDRILGVAWDAAAPDMDHVATQFAETDVAPFAQAVIQHKMRFLEMMDDDFNTAGAVAVMHELAGEVNAFVESRQIEKTRPREALAAITAATQTLRKLGAVLGLFRPDAAKAGGAKKDQDGLTDKLMALLIQLRAQSRAEKNFAMADAIRKGLTELGITLEDRADGTVWRKQ
jgi:cysteinyl-tRNA synthetase